MTHDRYHGPPHAPLPDDDLSLVYFHKVCDGIWPTFASDGYPLGCVRVVLVADNQGHDPEMVPLPIYRHLEAQGLIRSRSRYSAEH